jgi:hypothetical protein
VPKAGVETSCAEEGSNHILSMWIHTGGAEGKDRFASFGVAIVKGLWQSVPPPPPHGLTYDPGCMVEVAWRGGVYHWRREEV